MSWTLVAVAAAAGFAAFSPDQAAPEPAEPAPAAVVEQQLALPAVSGRTAAFVLAESLEFKGTFAERPDPPALLAVLGPDGSPTTTTTTTTTLPPTTTTEPPTTTTRARATTTTAQPAATTTTTAPPATTTTVASEPAETTTTTTTAPEPAGTGVERWRPLVEQYFRAEFVEEALDVIRCESNGDPSASNSRTGAAGLFQFMPRTWETASAGAGFAGASPFDGEANIASASWLVEESIRTDHPRGRWGHWSCRP